MKTLILAAALVFSPILVPDAHSEDRSPTLKLGNPLPENLFVELGKAINPAIVNISTSTTPKGRGNRGNMNDPMLEFLERFYGQGFSQPQQAPQTALGTGFVIRDDGLIITNNHVIDGADTINVQLTEDEEKPHRAEVIGRDARTDIALIKIKVSKKLPVAVLGSSKDLEVGEWVAAFGNPYGHGHTMTKGIISAKGREIAELNRYPFLQTDASINPGNSGGPLVNSKGLVIGVNTAIDARAQGIGFAIPIDNVKSVIADLEKNGKVRQGYIGVALGNLNPRAAKQLGLKQAEGVIITQVLPGGPAEKAGVETYDVVQELNGKKIKSEPDLMNVVAGATIGEKIKLKVLRENKDRILEITISERPDEKKIIAGNKKKVPGKDVPHKLGFKLADIDSKMVKEWGLDVELTGLPVVTEVDSDGAAAESGLRPGDVLLDVNRKRVRSAAQAMSFITPGNNSLRINRNGTIGLIVIEAE